MFPTMAHRVPRWEFSYPPLSEVVALVRQHGGETRLIRSHRS